MEVLDEAVESHGNVLLVPMHIDQDVSFCEGLRAQMKSPGAARVLAADVLSPLEVRELIRRAKMMIAFRLHAGIVATAAGVPTLTYYYVDKGRVYGDQVGMSAFTRPIEAMVTDDALVHHREREKALLSPAPELAEMRVRLANMREAIHTTFAQVIAGSK